MQYRTLFSQQTKTLLLRGYLFIYYVLPLMSLCFFTENCGYVHTYTNNCITTHRRDIVVCLGPMSYGEMLPVHAGNNLYDLGLFRLKQICKYLHIILVKYCFYDVFDCTLYNTHIVTIAAKTRTKIRQYRESWLENFLSCVFDTVNTSGRVSWQLGNCAKLMNVAKRLTRCFTIMNLHAVVLFEL